MTARTERHPAGPGDGVVGEGRKGLTARTERHSAEAGDGMEGEGRKGMTKEGSA